MDGSGSMLGSRKPKPLSTLALNATMDYGGLVKTELRDPIARHTWTSEWACSEEKREDKKDELRLARLVTETGLVLADFETNGVHFQPLFDIPHD